MSNRPIDQRLLELAELGVSMASILHEIRQPLYAMKGMAQIGLVRSSNQKKTLESILEQLEHLEETIGFYTDGLRSEPSRFDPNIAVERAVVMVSSRFRKRNIDFAWARDEGDQEVVGRPRALCQIVVNLLNNAVQATSAVGEPTIKLWTGYESTRALIVLADNGGGVCEEVRQTLFEPFVTSRPNKGGTGLGLYITSELVAAMNGTISVENKADGAVFRVELPLVSA